MRQTPLAESLLSVVSVLVLAASLCSSLVAGCEPLPQDPGAVPPKRPNIVFVYGDDHAQRATGCYGSPWMKTPHIDALAAGGMRFAQSFVANSICGPARATILTGLHSHANGQMTNTPGLRDDVPNVAAMLQESGYRTAVIGKWHLPGDPKGFDHWAIIGGGYYNPTMRTAEGMKEFPGYTTDVITDEALRWIEEGRKNGDDRPFFVWISHTASHRTWMPATRHLTMYQGEELPEPTTLFDDYAGRSPGAPTAQMRISKDLFPAYDLKLPITGDGILDDAAKARLGRMTDAERKAWDAAYGAENRAFLAAGLEGSERTRWNYQRYIKDYSRCVAAIDDSFGHVRSWLAERPELEGDTVVVYSSDQGFFLGEHGWYDKRWMYEPALCTPLVISWPGVVKPGTVDDHMVQNIDMAPTFLEIAGLDVPVEMHGRSLVPILRGQDPEWRDAIYYHYQQTDSGRTSHIVARHYGIRTDRWKLIYVYDHEFWELYDLEADPDEVHNLAGDPAHAVLLSKLKGRLAALRERYGDTTGVAF